MAGLPDAAPEVPGAPIGERPVCVRTFVEGELARDCTLTTSSGLHEAVGDGLTWVDLTDAHRSTLLALAEVYALHPLAIDEVFDTHRESDVNVYDGSAHVVIHYPHFDGDQRTFTSREIQAIIGEGFLITMHDPYVLDTDAVLRHWRATPSTWRSTSSSLLYALLRITMFTFSPVADRLADALDELEEIAISPENRGSPQRETLYNLFDLTEQITDLHNIAVPMQDMMRGLIHNSDWFSGENGNAYTRDIADDVVHLVNRLHMLRETGQRLFEMVNALIMLQRNDVSKQLTVVATIFLPLSFVVGYFGQNFRYMTDGVASRGQFLIWGVGAQVAALVVIYLALWRFGAFK